MGGVAGGMGAFLSPLLYKYCEQLDLARTCNLPMASPCRLFSPRAFHREEVSKCCLLIYFAAANSFRGTRLVGDRLLRDQSRWREDREPEDRKDSPPASNLPPQLL